MTKSKKRRNWKRTCILRGVEIKNLKSIRSENRALLCGIDMLIKLLRAVDMQGRNGTGWEARGRRYIKSLRPKPPETALAVAQTKA